MIERHAPIQSLAPTSPTGEVWPYLLISAVAAAFIDLGNFHRLQHGDTIVPVLVSLQRWTPYYWDADRYGMLLPLLALPIRHPFWNLLFQSWLGIFSGLASIFLLARYMVKDFVWRWAALVATVWFIATVPRSCQFLWLLEQQYGTAFTLALSALLILQSLEDSRRPAVRVVGALLLMGLASWVNFGIAAPLVGLVGARYALSSPGKKLSVMLSSGRIDHAPVLRLLREPDLRSLGLLGFGLAWGQAMVVVLVRQRVEVMAHGLIPLAEWPIAWSKFAVTTWGAMPTSLPERLVAFGIPALVAMLALVIPAMRRAVESAVRPCLALLLAAGGYWLLTGVFAWVKENSYVLRYSLPSLLFAEVALATWALAPLRLLPQKLTRTSHATFGAIALLALLAGVAMTYGLPSRAGARKDLDQKVGLLTREIIDARADLIVGSYWTVWPAVFHANLVAYERGEHQQVYGIAYRCNPTRRLWKGIPLEQLRLASAKGDPEVRQAMLNVDLCPTTREPRSQIDLLGAEACAPPQPPSPK